MAYDILHRVGIGAPADKVFETLTTLQGHRAWWDSNATGDAREGGVLTFFESHDMKVVQATPGEIVKWKVVRGTPEWMDTEITFRLVRKDGRTFVLFKHAGWKEPGEFMSHCSTRWGIFLACSLKPLLETGKGRPVPDDVKVD
jgi:uncharacterized protein YndB with AHSA1/START domain